VDYLRKYVIPFRGLQIDIHHYHLVIDMKFFESMEYADVADGNVEVDVTLDRHERMLIFNFDIRGTVVVPCDRCLDDFDLPISAVENLIVKFGENYEEPSDDVVIIPETASEFDISSYLYEYIVLMLPMQHIHPDDENGRSTCNSEMLERLRNKQVHKEHDPRWDTLKNLNIE
jgi:uncharacterized metal-binding protein YceD (DUF177 family)